MRRGLIPWLILGLVAISFAVEIKTEADLESFVDGGEDEVIDPEAEEIRAARQISRTFVRRRQRARATHENPSSPPIARNPTFDRRFENLNRPMRQFRMRRPPPLPQRPMFFRRRFPRPLLRPPQPPQISPISPPRVRQPQPPQTPPQIVRPEARIPQAPQGGSQTQPPQPPQPPLIPPLIPPRSQPQFPRLQHRRPMRPTTATMNTSRQSLSPSIPTAPPTFALPSQPTIAPTTTARRLPETLPQKPQDDSFDANGRRTFTRLRPQAARRFNVPNRLTRPPPASPPRISIIPSTQFPTSQTTTKTFIQPSTSSVISTHFTNPTTTINRAPSTFSSPPTSITTRLTNPSLPSTTTTQFQARTQTQTQTSLTPSTALFTTRGPAPPAPQSTTLTSRPSFGTSMPSPPSPPPPPPRPPLLSPPSTNGFNANSIDEPVPPARQPGLQITSFPTVPGSPAALPPDDVVVNALNVAEDFMAVARRFNLRRAMRRKRMAEWQRASLPIE
ncbi:unnamed protein product, partial [Mesorhabditis belari]|uniref:Uncharacterized protein n=1 Tax=Mesorhabditis belari TaxID=2138241 RepID=A0AAF3FEJ4_9BILA